MKKGIRQYSTYKYSSLHSKQLEHLHQLGKKC